MLSFGCKTSTALDELLGSSACGVPDPVKQFPWLNREYELIKNLPQGGIVLFTYQGKEVIEVQSSLMSSFNRSQYYCDGTRLVFDTIDTTDEYKDFLAKRVKIKVLWGVDFWRR